METDMSKKKYRQFSEAFKLEALQLLGSSGRMDRPEILNRAALSARQEACLETAL
jgi:hypothetical protein